MSQLSIADNDLKVSLQNSGLDKLRLVIVYPRKPLYCRRVMNALADLLRSDPSDSRADTQEANDEAAL